MGADTLKWKIDWRIRRYSEDDVARLAARIGREPGAGDFAEADLRPYDESLVPGNLVTTAGLGRITALIIGAGGQAASNTAARIGVGNGTTAAAVGDTDLAAGAGTGNRYFRPMDAGFPTQTAGAMTFQSTFGTGDGNFAWNEFGIDVGAPPVAAGSTVNPLLLNHKSSIAQGTKSAGQSWVATATITIS